jgi:hypothetical protein
MPPAWLSKESDWPFCVQAFSPKASQYSCRSAEWGNQDIFKARKTHAELVKGSPMRLHSMNFYFSLVLFVFWVGIPPAFASEVPFYSVKQWCDTVSKSAGNRSEMIYGGCIDQEQYAYNSIKEAWSTLPAQTQKWCDSVARSTGAGSYMILNGCIQQEMSAGKENSRRQFQR